jgi:hypothetical protein
LHYDFWIIHGFLLSAPWLSFGSLGDLHVYELNIADIRSVSGKELLFLLFLVSGAACPGILAIWNFAPQMLHDCSIPLLLLLSGSATLPIVSINSLLAIYAVFQSHEEKDFWSIFPICIAVGSCATLISISVPVLVAFLFGLSLKAFVYTAIGADSLYAGICVLMGLAQYKAPNTAR